jgi:hypothetical protein
VKKEYTETELLSFVSTFYNGNLHLEKAIKIFEIEYGFTPEIIQKDKNYVTDEWCRNRGFPWFVNSKSVQYMKELQESGITNMFESVPYIQNALGYDYQSAKGLLQYYMKYYEEFYYPQNCI